MRYKERVIVDAVQWFKRGDCPGWAVEFVRERMDHFLVWENCCNNIGDPGDWLVRDADGYVRLCRQGEFSSRYEPVNEPVDAEPVTHIQMGPAIARVTPRQLEAAQRELAGGNRFASHVLMDAVLSFVKKHFEVVFNGPHNECAAKRREKVQ